MSATCCRCGCVSGFVLACCLVIAGHAEATDHTWTGAIGNQWSDAGNWTNGVPVAGDSAIFSSLAPGASSTPTIGPGDTVDLSSILFPAGAPAYQLNVAAGTPDLPGSLTLSGSGISISSSLPLQTLNIDGTLRFLGNASGAKAAVVTNAGASFDISGLSTVGTTVGSIAGAGAYNLGGKNLTVVSSTNDTRVVSGVVSGVNSTLTLTGNGKLTLSGTNTFSGGLVLNNGSVIVNSSSALGTGGVSILGTAYVGYTNTSNVIPNAINLGAQVFVVPVDNSAAELEFAGPVNLLGATLRAGSAATVRFSNSISGVNKALSFTTDVNNVPGSFIFSGNLSNTYTGSTTVHSQTGPITLVLAKTDGATAIPSDLFINDHDTVRLAQPEQIADTATVHLSANATLDLDGYNETVAAIFSDQGSNFQALAIQLNSASRAGTLTVGSGSLVSPITDGGLGGNLIKISSGSLSLGRNSTYTGTTLVAAGTLVAASSSGSATGTGAVTVEPGASLAGHGPIGGPTLIKDQAILNPYPSGPFIFNSQLTLSSDSHILMQLLSPSDFFKNSEIAVSGQLTLDGTLDFDLTHGFGGKGDYLLFRYFGALIDDGLKIGTPPAGFGPSDFSIDTSQPGQVILRVLPEPTLLLPLLLMPLFLRRHQRKTHC